MKINIFSKYYNTPTKNKTSTIQGVSQSLWTDSLFGVYDEAFKLVFAFLPCLIYSKITILFLAPLSNWEASSL